MKFFNKKQDVIDIQLTSYGKKKLAKGNFKPFYYAFFDDNVIYDSAYGAFTEVQNKTQDRILENTQYLKINPIARGIESKLSEFNKMMFSAGASDLNASRTVRDAFSQNDVLEVEDFYGDNIQNAPDKGTICKYPLGNSKVGSQKAPAFTVQKIGGSFITEKFSNSYTGSGIVEEIPQIAVELTHTAKYDRNADILEEKDKFQQFLYPNNETFSPGGVSEPVTIRLEGDFLVLDFKEKNVDYFKENFEFEVFEIVTNEKTREVEDITEELIPLQLSNKSTFPSADPEESFLENYLEFSSDNNIPEVFLKAIGNLTNHGNSNINTFDSDLTEETESDTTSSPYSGNNQDPEDCK